MKTEMLEQQLEEALRDIPMMDIHTHLNGGSLGARGLHDVLLYHMSISDLYAAGSGHGARLTEFPGRPSAEEAEHRLMEAIPYLLHVKNTSTFWGVRTILSDLYDWHGEITADNWRTVDAAIRERADDRDRQYRILDKLNIRRTGTELSRRGDGEDDDRLQYALEWAFFTRCQWGEFDTALYELERCWGRGPEHPSPIGGARPAPGRTIASLADVHEAIDHYVSQIPYGEVLSMATHISTDIDFRPVAESEMEDALRRRGQAGPAERDIYASYVNEAFLSALERQSDKLVFQFSFGAEPLPFETSSRLTQRAIGQLALMIARHPDIRFQCFLSSRHANQSLCTLVRELPNLSLAGFWWHNFFPGAIRQVMEERLDMLPANKQIGFFSDAYVVEWTYAKAVIVRKLLAQVLAGKIRQGQYDMDAALHISRSILYESPQTLLGMTPRRIASPEGMP